MSEDSGDRGCCGSRGTEDCGCGRTILTQLADKETSRMKEKPSGFYLTVGGRLFIQGANISS